MSNLMILGNAPLTMSSAELLELVNQSRVNHGETPVRHNDFLARCKDELDGEPYENFVEPSKKTNKGLIPAFEAVRMTIDQCKLVGMRESKGVRRWVLNRLNALEAQQTSVLPNFSDPVAAARAWADAKEAEAAAKLAYEAAKPKVEFVDKFVQASTGSRGFREVCKLLKANEAEFRCFVIDRRIMYRLAGKLTAHQNHIDAGRFEVKAGVADNEHAYTTTKFTAKGVEWIAGEWAKHKVSVTLLEAA